MKLGITGTRLYDNYEFIKEKLNSLQLDVDYLISGGAKGVDKCCEKWAQENNIKIISHKPDYNKYERAAPLIRNKEIVNDSDILVGFPLLPRGTSHGTEYTISKAEEKGIKVILFPIELES